MSLLKLSVDVRLLTLLWPILLVVRKAGFQSANRSSILRWVTMNIDEIRSIAAKKGMVLIPELYEIGKEAYVFPIFLTKSFHYTKPEFSHLVLWV